MSRLADYFVIVGYDHEKERELLEFELTQILYFHFDYSWAYLQDRANAVERYCNDFQRKIGQTHHSLKALNG